MANSKKSSPKRAPRRVSTPASTPKRSTAPKRLAVPRAPSELAQIVLASKIDKNIGTALRGKGSTRG